LPGRTEPLPAGSLRRRLRPRRWRADRIAPFRRAARRAASGKTGSACRLSTPLVLMRGTADDAHCWAGGGITGRNGG
jgi:hypothetical protein